MDQLISGFNAAPLYVKALAICVILIALMFLEAAREERRFLKENPEDYDEDI